MTLILATLLLPSYFLLSAYETSDWDTTDIAPRFSPSSFCFPLFSGGKNIPFSSSSAFALAISISFKALGLMCWPSMFSNTVSPFKVLTSGSSFCSCSLSSTCSCSACSYCYPCSICSCPTCCCSFSTSSAASSLFCLLEPEVPSVPVPAAIVPGTRASAVEAKRVPKVRYLVQPSQMVKLQVLQCQYLLYALTAAAPHLSQCLFFLVPLMHCFKCFLCFSKHAAADFSSSST